MYVGQRVFDRLLSRFIPQETSAFFLLKTRSFLRGLLNLDHKRSTCPLHNDAKQMQLLIEECLLIGNDIIRGERSQDTYFVEGVGFLFLFEGYDLNLSWQVGYLF